MFDVSDIYAAATSYYNQSDWQVRHDQQSRVVITYKNKLKCFISRPLDVKTRQHILSSFIYLPDQHVIYDLSDSELNTVFGTLTQFTI